MTTNPAQAAPSTGEDLLTVQLEEERRIINAATAVPWFAHPAGKYVYDTPNGMIVDTLLENTDIDARANATFIAHARTALPLRNKQLQAVWRELNINRTAPKDDFDRGADAARSMIRRAIEEAGA